jgi:hypothetical protein
MAEQANRLRLQQITKGFKLEEHTTNEIGNMVKGSLDGQAVRRHG